MTSAEFMQSPRNEPILDYKSGSDERRALDQALDRYRSRTYDVPIVIGDQEYNSEEIRYQVMVSHKHFSLFGFHLRPSFL